MNLEEARERYPSLAVTTDEPVCGKCGHWNAILWHSDGARCRDCDFRPHYYDYKVEGNFIVQVGRSLEGEWVWIGSGGYCPGCASPDSLHEASLTTHGGLTVDYCCNCEKENPNAN